MTRGARVAGTSTLCVLAASMTVQVKSFADSGVGLWQSLNAARNSWPSGNPGMLKQPNCTP